MVGAGCVIVFVCGLTRSHMIYTTFSIERNRAGFSSAITMAITAADIFRYSSYGVTGRFIYAVASLASEPLAPQARGRGGRAPWVVHRLTSQSDRKNLLAGGFRSQEFGRGSPSSISSSSSLDSLGSLGWAMVPRFTQANCPLVCVHQGRETEASRLQNVSCSAA